MATPGFAMAAARRASGRVGPNRRCSARSWSRAAASRPDAIERALAKQREEGGLLGEVLVRLKLIDEDQLALALSLQSEMPYLRDLPRAEDIPVELIDKLPINFARQRLVLPLGRDAAGA